MKTFIFAALLLSSFNAMAQTSDFERGYDAGKAACVVAPTEAWVCSVPDYAAMYNCNATNSFATGTTREQAILQITGACLREAADSGISLTCQRL
jgi:hypothetical protein